MPTNHDDYTSFRAGLSASSTLFTNASFTQLSSYSGAASFAGYSTTGVAATAARALPASPTLAQLTDFVKVLAHDIFASKA